MHSELGRLVGSSKEQFWSTGRKDKRRVTRGNERCDGGPRTDSGMADPDCQNGFGALAHPLFVPCSLPATHSVYLLRTLLHSDCLLQNTTRPPFDRFVADRRRKRANSRISWGGAPRQAKGGAAMTFADGIGNLSSRKKEPTHAFDEQRTTEFASCRP